MLERCVKGDYLKQAINLGEGFRVTLTSLAKIPLLIKLTASPTSKFLDSAPSPHLSFKLIYNFTANRTG